MHLLGGTREAVCVSKERTRIRWYVGEVSQKQIELPSQDYATTIDKPLQSPQRHNSLPIN